MKVVPETSTLRAKFGSRAGVGIILGFGQVSASVVGLAVNALWRRRAPASHARRGELFGAAMLAGDGLAGVAQAALESSGVAPPWTFRYPGWWWR